jgi:site-specific DNA-cytosine methylase
MIVGDLFSGIGGFSLAAHWMGWRTAWFSEIDPYASRVLAHHWPDVPNLGDIRAIDWTTVEPVDVLTGGFPCQPHSLAGKRQGSNDERDLFDEIIRCAGVLRPRVIVLENVPGLFTSDAGRFFGRVLGTVAALGYDAEWRVLSAADVGAPHRRERVWIVAHAQQQRLQGSHVGRGVQDVGVSRHEPAGSCGDMGHANGGRREQRDASLGQSAVTGAGFVHVGDASRPRRAAGLSGPISRHERAAGVGHDAGDVLHWRHAVSVEGHDNTVRLIPREAAEGGPESAL